MRLGDGATLKPVSEASGFLGDQHSKTVKAVSAGPAPNYPVGWLPTERVARAWQAMVTEKPFEQ